VLFKGRFIIKSGQSTAMTLKDPKSRHVCIHFDLK